MYMHKYSWSENSKRQVKKRKMHFIIELRTVTCQYKIIEFIRYIKVFPKEMTKI